LLNAFSSSTPDVPSSWYNLTTACGGATVSRRHQHLQQQQLQQQQLQQQLLQQQPAPDEVDFVVKITVYSGASAVQLSQVTAAVVAVSLDTAAQLTAILSAAISVLHAAGGAPVITSGAAVAVNGQSCIGTACSSLLNPSSSAAAALSIGAIVGIVIGAIAVFIIAARVIVVRACKARGTRMFAVSAKETKEAHYRYEKLSSNL